MNEDTEDGRPEERGGIDRLPERSPLADPLPGLVVADDRDAFAARRNLEYRDDEVRVLVDLEPDGSRPEKYLSAVRTDLRTGVVAWVAVDGLVDLALDENVRLIRREPPASPHGSEPTAEYDGS